jgi:hypothetical protein
MPCLNKLYIEHCICLSATVFVCIVFISLFCVKIHVRMCLDLHIILHGSEFSLVYKV